MNYCTLAFLKYLSPKNWAVFYNKYNNWSIYNDTERMNFCSRKLIIIGKPFST